MYNCIMINYLNKTFMSRTYASAVAFNCNILLYDDVMQILEKMLIAMQNFTRMDECHGQ